MIGVVPNMPLASTMLVPGNHLFSLVVREIAGQVLRIVGVPQFFQTPERTMHRLRIKELMVQGSFSAQSLFGKFLLFEFYSNLFAFLDIF